MLKNLNLKNLKKGTNINSFLRINTKLHEKSIIKISYDYQAGTYIKNFDHKLTTKMLGPMINELNNSYYKSLLDFGTGELTTLYALTKKLKKKPKLFACDCSFLRLKYGFNKFKKYFSKKDLTLFVNSPYKLPFKNNSIDIIITCHALEPNKKNFDKILDELIRVCANKIILIEPDFSIANKKAKKRFLKHNYITNFEKILRKLPIKYRKEKIKYNLNNLNPASMFVVDPIKKIKIKNKAVFFDKKIDKKNYLKFKDSHFFSKNLKKKISYKDGIYLFSKN